MRRAVGSDEDEARDADDGEMTRSRVMPYGEFDPARGAASS
jgi:hypothetical protein